MVDHKLYTSVSGVQAGDQYGRQVVVSFPET